MYRARTVDELKCLIVLKRAKLCFPAPHEVGYGGSEVQGHPQLHITWGQTVVCETLSKKKRKN